MIIRRRLYSQRVQLRSDPELKPSTVTAQRPFAPFLTRLDASLHETRMLPYELSPEEARQAASLLLKHRPNFNAQSLPQPILMPYWLIEYRRPWTCRLSKSKETLEFTLNTRSWQFSCAAPASAYAPPQLPYFDFYRNLFQATPQTQHDPITIFTFQTQPQPAALQVHGVSEYQERQLAEAIVKRLIQTIPLLDKYRSSVKSPKSSSSTSVFPQIESCRRVLYPLYAVECTYSSLPTHHFLMYIDGLNGQVYPSFCLFKQLPLSAVAASLVPLFLVTSGVQWEWMVGLTMGAGLAPYMGIGYLNALSKRLYHDSILSKQTRISPESKPVSSSLRWSAWPGPGEDDRIKDVASAQHQLMHAIGSSAPLPKLNSTLSLNMDPRYSKDWCQRVRDHVGLDLHMIAKHQPKDLPNALLFAESQLSLIDTSS